MNRKRSAAIAAQVIVVGVVALVVTLTLLQPDGNDPLFGVTTPEEAGRVDLRQDPDDRRNGNGGDRDNDRRNGSDGDGKPPLGLVDRDAGAGSGMAGSSAGGLGTVGTPTPAPWAPPVTQANSGGDDSPTLDQYGDALARLTAKLD